MHGELTQWGRAEDLLPFLARRVALYTGMDHSSVPKDLALELFASARFTLEQGPENALNLEERFAAGLSVTQRKLEYGKKLLRAVRGSLPKIDNISLYDTLKSLVDFFRRYDFRFFAHQVPCDIDYQLCLPVPETLEGIDYVNRYLSHLAVENGFLNRFDPSRAARLLEVCCGDYRGLLINLFEPVATNALALALVGRDTANLSVSQAERDALGELLLLEPEALERAAEKLCALLGIGSAESTRYLAQLAQNLRPRIRETDLSGVFLTIS